jgi:hypothetical protein
MPTIGLAITHGHVTTIPLGRVLGGYAKPQDQFYSAPEHKLIYENARV